MLRGFLSEMREDANSSLRRIRRWLATREAKAAVFLTAFFFAISILNGPIVRLIGSSLGPKVTDDPSYQFQLVSSLRIPCKAKGKVLFYGFKVFGYKALLNKKETPFAGVACRDIWTGKWIFDVTRYNY